MFFLRLCQCLCLCFSVDLHISNWYLSIWISLYISYHYADIYQFYRVESKVVMSRYLFLFCLRLKLCVYHISVYPSICLSISLFISVYLYLSVYPCVCLIVSVGLCIYITPDQYFCTFNFFF